MNGQGRAGDSDPPRRAMVWLRRWQVEEEGLTVRVGDTVEWQCLPPSAEAAAMATAAGLVLTADFDTYAGAVESGAIRPVQGVVEATQEVRIDGHQIALDFRDVVSPIDAIELTNRPGFIVTVHLRVIRAAHLS